MSTLHTFMDELKYVSDYFIKNGFTYVASNKSSSWEKALKRKSSNCAILVTLAMQRSGLLKSDQVVWFSDGLIKFVSFANYSKEDVEKELKKHFDVIKINKKWKDYKKDAKPGDVVGWHTHTSVYANQENGKDYWYDSGPGATVDQKAGSKFKIIYRTRNQDDKIVYYILRLKKLPYNGSFPALPERKYFKTGDKSADVLKLNNFLKWYGNYDFEYPMTIYNSENVKKFQKAEGLVVDGLFGEKSLAKSKTVKRQ